MGYIGVQPTDTYLSIASQQITGNGGATYTLDYSVSDEESVAVFVNNVRQNVSTYTVSSNQLTLGGTISASDSCWVLFLGRTVGTKTPAVGSVTNDMLAGSIATSKLADITANGITEADHWRLTTGFAVSGVTQITSNLERIDTYSQGLVGSGMTESSGIFTFPSTGIYLVIFNIYANYNATSPIYYCENYINVSTDGGSSFSIATNNATSMNSDVRNGTAIGFHLLDVTDTSLIKVKFSVGSSSTPLIAGGTSTTSTSFLFVRLGDT